MSVECPQCYGLCEGGRYGADAWCRRCTMRYRTEWHIETQAARLVGSTGGRPCTAEEWDKSKEKPR